MIKTKSTISLIFLVILININMGRAKSQVINQISDLNQNNQEYFEIPKGDYSKKYSSASREVYCEQTIYKTDVWDMSESWESAGFIGIADAFTTGKYGANEKHSTTSPTLHIPLCPHGARVFLRLDSKLHSEKNHDFAHIRIINASTGKTSTYYTATGVGEREVEYIDITHFTGADIKFQLEFTSDSTYHGSGWSIYSLSVCGNDIIPETSLRSDTRNQTDSNNQIVSKNDNIKIEIISTNIESKDKGTIYFTMKNGEDYISQEHFDRLKSDSFTLTLKDKDGTMREISPSCLSLSKVRDKNTNIDIIYAIDHSGSMSGAIKNLAITVNDTLHPLLKDSCKYNIKWASVEHCDFIDGKDVELCNINWQDRDLGYEDIYDTLRQPIKTLFPAGGGKTRGGFGNMTYCFWVLKKIVERGYSYRENSQKVIVMLGGVDNYAYEWGPTPTPKDRNKDCSLYSNIRFNPHEDLDTPETDTLKQADIASLLKLNGFQTFVVYDTCYYDYDYYYGIYYETCAHEGGFSQIIRETNGAFVLLGYKGTFETKKIVDGIQKSMDNRYCLEFDLGGENCKNNEIGYECGDTASVELRYKNAETGNAKDKAIVNFMPKIIRDGATVAYDNTILGCRDSATIAFSIEGTCEGDSPESVKIIYGDNESTGVVKLDTVSLDPIGKNYKKNIALKKECFSSLAYKIQVKMKKGRYSATSQPNTSLGMWTINDTCPTFSCEVIPYLQIDTVIFSCDSIFVEISNGEILSNAVGNEVKLMYSEYNENTEQQYNYQYKALSLERKEKNNIIYYTTSVPEQIKEKTIVYWAYLDYTDQNEANKYQAFYGNGIEDVRTASIPACVSHTTHWKKRPEKLMEGDTIVICSLLPDTLYLKNTGEDGSELLMDSVTFGKKDAYEYKKLSVSADSIAFSLNYKWKEPDTTAMLIHTNAAGSPFKLIVVTDPCEAICTSARLTANPIMADSCILSFTTDRKADITFAIYDEEGKPLMNSNSKAMKVTRTIAEGSHDIKMTDLFSGLFDLKLNPRKPYILAITDGRETAMIYFYVSRLKKEQIKKK